MYVNKCDLTRDIVPKNQFFSPQLSHKEIMISGLVGPVDIITFQYQIFRKVFSDMQFRELLI